MLIWLKWSISVLRLHRYYILVACLKKKALPNIVMLRKHTVSHGVYTLFGCVRNDNIYTYDLLLWWLGAGVFRFDRHRTANCGHRDFGRIVFVRFHKWSFSGSLKLNLIDSFSFRQLTGNFHVGPGWEKENCLVFFFFIKHEYWHI